MIPDLALGPGPGRVARQKHEWNDSYGVSHEEELRVSLDMADVITSEMSVGSGLHAPVLDLDVPHRIVPSSTQGHAHLFIDVPMPWRRYRKLLKALWKAGVIEEGYYRASVRRGYTAVRVPWQHKDKTDLR